MSKRSSKSQNLSTFSSSTVEGSSEAEKEATNAESGSSESEKPMEVRSPLRHYRPYGLRVTDLRDQIWCERQLAFTLEHGRKKTAAMRQGEERHQALFEEVAEVIVKVRPRSREDIWALHLFNSWVGLRQLKRDGLCRELPVFGRVGGVWIIGIIDELEILPEASEILLTDTKTRQKPRLPTEAQKRTTRLQMMLYKALYDQLVEQTTTNTVFFESLGVSATEPFTEKFALDMEDAGMPSSTLGELVPLVLDEFATSPPIGRQLQIRYEWQKDHTLIGADTFLFRGEWLDTIIQQGLPYWHGEREARGVDVREKWKCRFCTFREPCPHFSEGRA